MSKIPILRPVATGYSDAWNAVRAMPLLAGYVLLIMLAINLLEYFVPTRGSDNGLGATAIGIVVNAAQNFFATPIMIAVHRYIILEQITPSYVLEPGTRTFRAFFGWLTALSTLGLLSVMVFSPAEGASMFPVGAAVTIMVVLVVISVRLSILFPAIAIEAPGATVVNAWYDSKRNTFRIFLIFVLSVLPLGIGALGVLVVFGEYDNVQTDTSLGIPGIVGIAVMQTFFLILCVAIASRLYQALADRLLGHARSPV